MGAVATIPLSHDLVALVDESDFEMLSSLKWHPKPGRRTTYALANLAVGERWTTVPMHRVIMLPDPGVQVDHINGNGLDNRRCNLRLCDRRENRRNARPRLGTTSQFTGVSACYGRWRAGIRREGRFIHLGVFSDEVAAARAYDEAALLLFGEFARTNFPDKAMAGVEL